MKKIIYLVSFLFIFFVVTNSIAHAETLVKANLIYPANGDRDVPTTITAKWDLPSFDGVGECHITFRNRGGYMDVPTVSAVVPCTPGPNSHEFTLRPSMTYEYYIIVYVDGYFKNTIWNLNIFKTVASTENTILGDFSLLSPNVGSTVSNGPLFSWTVPSSSEPTIKMTLCVGNSPTSPLPAKTAISCKTGETCELMGNYANETWENNTIFYWHAVAGDICWKDVKVSGNFIYKKSTTTVAIPVIEQTVKASSTVVSVVPVKNIDAQLTSRLKGQIVLQVESRGEAWYINPKDGKRYYMANGSAAYEIMRSAGIGISNKDLDKMKNEAEYRKKYIGKIFLQVESRGEAYYISSNGRYNYLKDGAAAYEIMRSLGLGISNINLEKIAMGNN